MVHFNSTLSYEALVVLGILDWIKEGFVDAVFLFSPAASWSRARHIEGSTPLPLRNRTQPSGLDTLSAMDSVQVVEGNRDIEVSCWFAEQALRCKPHRFVR